MRTSFLVLVFSLVLIAPVLLLTGRVSFGSQEISVSQDVYAQSGCTPGCNPCGSNGTQTCWDSNCDLFSQSCTPPPCETVGDPCNGGPNYCCGSATCNMEGTVQADCSCSTPVNTPHTPCACGCSGGTCVPCPTPPPPPPVNPPPPPPPPPPGVTCDESSCTAPCCGSGLMGCSDGVARSCSRSTCCGGGPPPPPSQGYYQSYYQGYYYGQGSYCTPSWSCQTPYNGTECDGCGSCRPNSSCNPAYIQAAGASVHSNASIIGIADSAIPGGQYFNPGQYGVVSSMGSFSFSPSKTNVKQWQLSNYPTSTSQLHTNPKYDHDYFWNLYKGSITKTINANSITSGDLQTSGTDPEFIAIHPVAGNTVTFNTPINITGSKLVVVFVNSLSGTPVNLTVGGRVRTTSDAFILWIVSGNVTIDSAVDEADGYYLSSGSYNSGSGSTQLNVDGGVAAYGGVNLGRRNTNTSLPSEVFTYNPQIVRLAPLLGQSNYTWTEIIP